MVIEIATEKFGFFSDSQMFQEMQSRNATSGVTTMLTRC